MLIAGTDLVKHYHRNTRKDSVGSMGKRLLVDEFLPHSLFQNESNDLYLNRSSRTAGEEASLV
jgi:hypothetical protein